ncbi:MAG: GHKL domain-containing protein [Rhizobacter sp.]|nr:GHKL domain-containing protein [Bacteriovorax sp.]
MSENKDFELKFNNLQQKLNAIFYGSETPMVIFQGPDMILEMFNSKYQDIYQGRVHIGQSLFDAIPELKNTPFPEILKKVHDTGKHYVSHERLAQILNKESGKLEDRYFDSTFSCLHFGENEPIRILATPREVTDRVRTRIQLEESLKNLEQERELRDRFVSALTHDLRSPLAIAKLCTEILKREFDDPKTVKEMAEKVSNSIDRADRLIYDLLDASRIRAGAGIQVLLNECRLDLVIENVISDLKDIYGPRFCFKNHCGEISGYWDNIAIYRLLENLLINAVKYGDQHIPINISLNTDHHFVEISIHNEGQHIPIEEQKYLFDQYSRFKQSNSDKQVGWGIGLAIVKGLTEAHKGKVRVESSPGKGTTFFIKIPIDSRQK